MDSAKKFNKDADQNADSDPNAPENRDDFTPTGERRLEPDGKRRDRRVIARFADPLMRSHARQIRILSRVWNAISIVYLLLLGAIYATKGKAESTRSLFEAVVVIIVAVAVYRVGRAAGSYIENESVARLSILVERTYMLLFVMCILAAVMAAVHLVTLW